MRSRSMQSLTDDIKRRHPGIVIYGVGDDDHKLRISDHNEDDTPGSLAAQSDADNVPEHRAIDIMLGPAFTRAQAYALIADLLADPAALVRLVYLIFDGSIWSKSRGWEPRDFDGDPHTDHVHASGDADDDENAAGWPAVDGGDMVTDDDIKRLAKGFWEYNAGTRVSPVFAITRLNQAAATSTALLPKLDAILVAAEDDGDTTVVLDAAALAAVREVRDMVAALPTAEETADAVVDEQVARLSDG